MIYIITDVRVRRDGRDRTLSSKRKTVVVVGLGVVGLVALVAALLLGTGVIGGAQTAAVPPAGTPAPPPPAATVPPGASAAPVVRFTSPGVGQVVTADGVRVFGSVTGLAPDDRLWLVTLANPRRPVDTYQPQDTSCTTTPAGDFDCRTAYVGGDDAVGRSFDIVITRVTSAAADAFAAYDASDPAARGYPGLDNLPAGSDPIGYVQVVRG